MIVAIDGPAGSGKGTVTKILSEKLGFTNLDTGAIYRCVAIIVLENNLKVEQKDEIIKLLDNINIEFLEEKVYLNGIDVTKKIRSKEVNDIVFQVSGIVEVRIKMVELQRKMAEGKDVIMEGRDIGTYVFPNADVKIYLDADEEERAKRRYKENCEKGIEGTYEEILENIRKRDYNDKHKQIGSLKIADDAIVIDSTSLPIEEVVEKIETIIRQVMKND